MLQTNLYKYRIKCNMKKYHPEGTPPLAHPGFHLAILQADGDVGKDKPQEHKE